MILCIDISLTKNVEIREREYTVGYIYSLAISMKQYTLTNIS